MDFLLLAFLLLVAAANFYCAHRMTTVGGYYFLGCLVLSAFSFGLGHMLVNYTGWTLRTVDHSGAGEIWGIMLIAPTATLLFWRGMRDDREEETSEVAQ